MDASALQEHAHALVAQVTGAPARDADVLLRRAMSAAYYALFHALTTAGAGMLAPTNPVLRNQVARAFNHGAMRKICDAYVRSPHKPFQQGLDHLNPSVTDARLVQVAEAFGHLQEARYAADYDLLFITTRADVSRLLAIMDFALANLQAIQSDPDTQTFLAALLLSDRWSRRG